MLCVQSQYITWMYKSEVYCVNSNHLFCNIFLLGYCCFKKKIDYVFFCTEGLKKTNKFDELFLHHIWNKQALNQTCNRNFRRPFTRAIQYALFDCFHMACMAFVLHTEYGPANEQREKGKASQFKNFHLT